MLKRIKKVSKLASGVELDVVGGDSLKVKGELFAQPVSRSNLHTNVVSHLAKKRAGTHATLTKGEMVGGKKKPFKQKGTGRARAGNTVSPHWVGGGVAHGPQPRKYIDRLSKRSKTKGLVDAIALKISEGSIRVVQSMGVHGKTREFANFLGSIGLSDSKVGVLVSKNDDLVIRGARNISGVSVLYEDSLSAYALLNQGVVVVEKATFQRVLDGLESKTGVQ